VNHGAVRDEVTDQRGNKERVAAGMAMNHRRQSRRESGVLEFATQILRDLCQLERLERDVLAESVDGEILSQPTERAVQRAGSGALRSEEQDPHRFPSASKC